MHPIIGNKMVDKPHGSFEPSTFTDIFDLFGWISKKNIKSELYEHVTGKATSYIKKTYATTDAFERGLDNVCKLRRFVKMESSKYGPDGKRRLRGEDASAKEILASMLHDVHSVLTYLLFDTDELEMGINRVHKEELANYYLPDPQGLSFGSHENDKHSSVATRGIDAMNSTLEASIRALMARLTSAATAATVSLPKARIDEIGIPPSEDHFNMANVTCFLRVFCEKATDGSLDVHLAMYPKKAKAFKDVCKEAVAGIKQISASGKDSLLYSHCAEKSDISKVQSKILKFEDYVSWFDKNADNLLHSIKTTVASDSDDIAKKAVSLKYSAVRIGEYCSNMQASLINGAIDALVEKPGAIDGLIKAIGKESPAPAAAEKETKAKVKVDQKPRPTDDKLPITSGASAPKEPPVVAENLEHKKKDRNPRQIAEKPKTEVNSKGNQVHPLPSDESIPVRSLDVGELVVPGRPADAFVTSRPEVVRSGTFPLKLPFLDNMPTLKSSMDVNLTTIPVILMLLFFRAKIF